MTEGEVWRLNSLRNELNKRLEHPVTEQTLYARDDLTTELVTKEQVLALCITIEKQAAELQAIKESKYVR